MIKEPIFIIEDNINIYKYDSITCAEKDLEAYDLELYIGYDSNFNKLELYKKDKYNRVGFRLINDKKQYHDELERYVKIFYDKVLEKPNTIGDLNNLLNHLESEKC